MKNRQKRRSRTNDPLKNLTTARCVSGYLRKKGYAADYAKNDCAFLKDLAVGSKKDTAMKNASRLRWEQIKRTENKEKAIYELNPFTDIDALVRRFTGETMSFEWCEFGSMYVFDQIEITVAASGSMSMKNRGNKSRVISESDICIYLIRGNEPEPWLPNTGEHILPVNKAKRFELPRSETVEIRMASKSIYFVHQRK